MNQISTFRERLSSVTEMSLRKPLDDHEAAEKVRAEMVGRLIIQIRDAGEVAQDDTEETLQERLQMLIGVSSDASIPWGNSFDRAMSALAMSVDKLNAALSV